MRPIIYSIFSLFLLVALSACSKDFLDRPPIDQITDGAYYQSDAEVIMGTAPLYNVTWFEYTHNSNLTLGDIRAGNMITNDRYQFYQFNVPAGRFELLRAWQSMYVVIAHSNNIINDLQKRISSDVSEFAYNHAIGEARFMRGMAYTYLVMNWGPVPIIDNNVEQLTDTTITRNTVESIWEFIVRDFRFAAQNLPETPIAEGRLTKWSAEGALAKAFLFRSGLNGNGSRNQTDLDSARYYAGRVCNLSGLNLLPNYGDLFKTQFDNNEESLFQLQWMGIGAGFNGVNNVFQAFYAYDPLITCTGDGWGRAHGASADLVKYYETHPEDSLRRKATFMFNGDFISELNTQNGGLDYIISDIANIKKYIVGCPEENDGLGGNASTAVNTYILRLAEVYLDYAEAILGNQSSTSDPEALKFFNLVRTRAGLPELSGITIDDILQEKRIELAIECSYWYELVAQYYYNPQKVLDMIANQDKGSYTIEVVEGSNPIERIFTYPLVDDQGAAIIRNWPASPETMFFPIPEVEVARAPNLKKPPVPYEF